MLPSHKQRLADAFRSYFQAHSELSAAMDNAVDKDPVIDNDSYSEDYPFNQCFFELLQDVSKWCNTSIAAIQKSESTQVQDWTQAIFTIEYEVFYVGYYIPTEHWNGWRKPYFTKDIAEAIVSSLPEGNDDPHRMQLHWEGDNIIDTRYYEGKIEDVSTIEPQQIVVNGKSVTVYFLGLDWIWTAVPPSTKTFFYNDMSRGETAKDVTLVNVIDENQDLNLWAIDANEGDEYTTNDNKKYTCTSN